MDIFTTNEAILLVRLLVAHTITDFFLQTNRGIAAKQTKLLRSTSFWMHGFYTALFAGVSMGNSFSFPLLILITATHLIFDYWKIALNKKISDSKWEQKQLWLFIIDQILHIIVIIVAWMLLIDGFERMKELVNRLFDSYAFFVRLLSYLLVAGPVAYLIKFLTIKWADDIAVDDSLKDAGKWIGILERLIVITLIFIEQYTAIGFLVAAKSILRLIDKPERVIESKQGKTFSPRKHTEYVLIGTFLSFGIAIIIGLLANWLIG